MNLHYTLKTKQGDVLITSSVNELMKLIERIGKVAVGSLLLTAMTLSVAPLLSAEAYFSGWKGPLATLLVLAAIGVVYVVKLRLLEAWQVHCVQINQDQAVTQDAEGIFARRHAKARADHLCQIYIWWQSVRNRVYWAGGLLILVCSVSGIVSLVSDVRSAVITFPGSGEEDMAKGGLAIACVLALVSIAFIRELTVCTDRLKDEYRSWKWLTPAYSAELTIESLAAFNDTEGNAIKVREDVTSAYHRELMILDGDEG